MYIPQHYELTDRSILAEVIRANSFGVIVTSVPGGPLATHIPFLLHGSADTNGKLQAHVARANTHWQSFESADEPSLIVFQGPHAYVSDADYGVEERIVPVWHHILIHCYGRPRLIESPELTRRHLEELVETYEAGRGTPWSLSSQPTDYLENMSRCIVAFDIPIERIEGKASLSQSHPAHERESVAFGLESSVRQADRETAFWMRKLGI